MRAIRRPLRGARSERINSRNDYRERNDSSDSSDSSNSYELRWEKEATRGGTRGCILLRQQSL